MAKHKEKEKDHKKPPPKPEPVEQEHRHHDPHEIDLFDDSAEGVTEETLNATPSRALSLLRGFATNVVIRQVMAQRGYSAQEHARGWNLLKEASGFSEGQKEPVDDSGVRDAIAQLDDWDESGFRIATAALKHRHPAQFAFVFAGLSATKGPSAVLGVETFLDRLDALENSPKRKSTEKDDHAAIATLTARGITPEERKRLRSLVDKARSFTTPESDPNKQAETEAKQRSAALRSLREWFEEWSEIARTVIKRRDHLILLGLAQRKPRQPPPPPPPPPPRD